jgi:hypothetical protein
MCGQCASALAGYPQLSRGKAFLYYACLATRSKLNYARQCDCRNFRANEVDDWIWTWIRGFLSDPIALQESITAFQSDCEREAAPLTERIVVIDSLLKDNRQQMTRLLDLYLRSEFEMDALTDRKKRLETTIQALSQERDSLTARLKAQTLSDERMQRILAFADRQSEKVQLAANDFAIRRSLIEELDAKGTVVWENDEMVIYARCILGEETLRAPSITTSGSLLRTDWTGWIFTTS